MALALTIPHALPLAEAVACLRKQVISDADLAAPCSSRKRFEIPLLSLDIKSLLAGQRRYPLIYWQDRDGNQEVGGLGIADEIRSAEQGVQAVSLISQELLQYLPAGMRYFGGACFDSRSKGEEWKGFPALWFVLPRLEIIRSGEHVTLAVNVRQDDSHGHDMEATLRELDHIALPRKSSAYDVLLAVRERDIPNRDDWNGIVDGVLRDIHNKKISKLVLARRTDFVLNKPADPFQLLQKLQEITPGCFHFLMQPSLQACFLGASPERLYKRCGLRILSEAVAGTRPRGSNAKKDDQLRDELLNSPKELREHQFVVDAIKESLSPLASFVRGDDHSPRVARFSTGQHLFSGVEGTLHQGVHDAEILSCMHPTPAVAGSPTQCALEQIRQVESFSRGWYAGPVGWLGREESEFAVAIRSGLLSGKHFSVFAGAGIVAGSDPLLEWDEVEHKIGSILKVFSL